MDEIATRTVARHPLAWRVVPSRVPNARSPTEQALEPTFHNRPPLFAISDAETIDVRRPSTATNR
eukprot:1938430-Alexandrium_andersonii.AAC.1